MIRTGLDALLERPQLLAGKRYGLLSHPAALCADWTPAHLALCERCPPGPALLFGPEHGFYGVEQDMVAAADSIDAVTGARIASLYGTSASSLRPDPAVFADLDVLLIDLQDVGARYYTFAATAVWATEVALAAGCAVWILDRPNPLGGETIEGNLPQPGYESFVGAFRLPVRHGLTLGEIVRLEAQRGRFDLAGVEIFPVCGWQRSDLWPATGRAWVAPSPNMPSFTTALLYPGLCLIEATELSEGRGTTRPFQLVGAPGLPALDLARELASSELLGVRFVPTFFKPQFQKHRDQVCGGVEIVVDDPSSLASYRCGVAVLAAVRAVAPELLRWRQAPYEFVADRPAIDLLAGCDTLRRSVTTGRGSLEWMASWRDDEESFRSERRAALLYA
jgi:uncharacterized protein YbbC (DUF1343 family)